MTTTPSDDLARFWTKVNRTPTCWTWTAKLDKGYGRFWVAGRLELAHRYSYEHFRGPVPEGLQLDHLCRNRACVRPGHLQAVTIGENVLRGIGLSAQNAAKVACKRGHPFDDTNTVIIRRPTGRIERHCRACNTLRAAAWRARAA